MSLDLPAVEVTLAQIVEGKGTAPPGLVHVVGRDVLVRAIAEIAKLRRELEKEKLANASARVLVSSPKPGPM